MCYIIAVVIKIYEERLIMVKKLILQGNKKF